MAKICVALDDVHLRDLQKSPSFHWIIQSNRFVNVTLIVSTQSKKDLAQRAKFDYEFQCKVGSDRSYEVVVTNNKITSHKS